MMSLLVCMSVRLKCLHYTTLLLGVIAPVWHCIVTVQRAQVDAALVHLTPTATLSVHHRDALEATSMLQPAAASVSTIGPILIYAMLSTTPTHLL